MNRPFIGLLTLAIGVWCWVVFQLLSAILGSDGDASALASREMPALSRSLLAAPAEPLELKRDPFRSALYAEKPAPVAKPSVARKPVAAPIAPPDVTVDGILMGDAPVAILKKGGVTELVKAGQSVWDLTVVKITEGQVVLRKQGKLFTLTYP